MLHVICDTGGVPAWILSDNGAEFEGEFQGAVQALWYRAPGHSQSQGMVERPIATTELTLAHFVDDYGGIRFSLTLSLLTTVLHTLP